MLDPIDSVIMRTLLRPIVVMLQLFALYVVIHGHYSPGGGFQGGTLLACSFILPRLVYGSQERGFAGLSVRGAGVLAVVGVAIFAGVGLVGMVFGGQFLDYGALPFGGLEAPDRRSLGILIIEIGVTLGVTGAILAIFYSLYGEGNGEAK